MNVETSKVFIELFDKLNERIKDLEGRVIVLEMDRQNREYSEHTQSENFKKFLEWDGQRKNDEA